MNQPALNIVQEAKPERPPEEKEKPKDAAASETRLWDVLKDGQGL